MVGQKAPDILIGSDGELLVAISTADGDLRTLPPLDAKTKAGLTERADLHFSVPIYLDQALDAFEPLRKYPFIRLDIERLDSDHAEFRLAMRRTPVISAEIHGVLIRWQGDATRIDAESRREGFAREELLYFAILFGLLVVPILFMVAFALWIFPLLKATSLRTEGATIVGIFTLLALLAVVMVHPKVREISLLRRYHRRDNRTLQYLLIMLFKQHQLEWLEKPNLAG
jgi:hypothetical protein